MMRTVLHILLSLLLHQQLPQRVMGHDELMPHQFLIDEEDVDADAKPPDGLKVDYHNKLITDYAREKDNNLLICLESMFEADRDKDKALTKEEYKLFEKYYASQRGYTHPPDEMWDLFATLQVMGGENLASPDAINVMGSDPIVDRTEVGDERLEVLENMCNVVEACVCCGVCLP